ncbi:hypothetical protein SAMN05216489_01486 [Streptomyces sp. 3213]|uniref:hypothetical protein n=1 Tax=Streptomyces sp. 3213.3 TaxID=1855348 RepID=UPI0008965C07|nr:hypothetical protein [Streptomyces sp. 3213.3]SEC73480.1 hypothetical protein SAMN05216489_01486 [Streptomyces sp. 3213] [Streptomyces sp. 3213.3]
MDGFLGNAMGFDAPSTPEQLVAGRAELSLRPLLDQDRNSPMLVVNGATTRWSSRAAATPS